MPNRPDATALLRGLRPEPDYDPDAPAALARLEELLNAPPERAPRPPRRRARRVLVAGAVAAAAGVVAVTALPSAPGGLDIVSDAVAVLQEPDTILHYRATVRAAGSDEIRTIESWQAAGGRQERTLFDHGALEAVEDWDARTNTTYNAERNEVLLHTDPDYFRGDGPVAIGDSMNTTTLGDLARLLERARRGDQRITLVGETTVDGTPVYELRIARELPQPVTFTTTLFIGREDHLPVRVVERGPGERVRLTIDYQLAERIERTPATEHLLQMAPHPGARVTDEGDFD